MNTRRDADEIVAASSQADEDPGKHPDPPTRARRDERCVAASHAGDRSGWLTRAQVRDLDRRAIEEYGLPGIVLMENAGRGVAELVARLWPQARPVAIACGRGNNGADGFVIARHLELLGRPVHVLLAADPGSITGDAATMLAVASRSRIRLVPLAAADAATWAEHLAGAAVVVDALLGTGATGAPRGGIATAIDAIAGWRAATPAGGVLAVDLPSGLDCDTGQAAGPCVRADVTATFVAPKQGFAAAGAAAFTGPVHVVGIGAPRRLLAEFGVG
jgi:NAD(P)H-hydrate epimerase